MNVSVKKICGKCWLVEIFQIASNVIILDACCMIKTSLELEVKLFVKLARIYWNISKFLWNLEWNNIKWSIFYFNVAVLSLFLYFNFLQLLISLVLVKVLLTSRSEKYGSSAALVTNVSGGELSWGNFSFYFAQLKKYRLVGWLHVDFNRKIVRSSSSFSFVKQVLIWNNMLTVKDCLACACHRSWSVGSRLAERVFTLGKGWYPLEC